jgi:hypothetical protein
LPKVLTALLGAGIAVLGLTGWLFQIPHDVQDLEGGVSSTPLTRMMLIVLVVLAWALGVWLSARFQAGQFGAPRPARVILIAGSLLCVVLAAFLICWRSFSAPYSGSTVWIGVRMSESGRSLASQFPTASAADLVQKAAGDINALWPPWSVALAQIVVTLLFTLTMAFVVFLAVFAANLAAGRVLQNPPQLPSGNGPRPIQPPNTVASFDVFLSHNSCDKPTIRDLVRCLRQKGVTVWLDEDELRPGIPWQSLLEKGINSSRSVAVVIGRDGVGPWEDEEMQGALRLAAKDRRPIIPVLLPGSPAQPELPMFLGNRTWVDLRGGLAGEGIGKLIWGISGQKRSS